MCCLFGLLDSKGVLSGNQKTHIISALATAAEARGTDASGIAYNHDGHMTILKRPVAGHLLRAHIPRTTQAVMGHTRMTTQGNEKRNQNNHPFCGELGQASFALAHNGILYNDWELRHALALPATNIETDSYVAVQLLEKRGELSFDSLRYMAENVRGSFCFTVLDEQNALWFVKGDNPLCLYHFPRYGVYLYASTREILEKALAHVSLPIGHSVEIPLLTGDLLRLGADGKQTRSSFDVEEVYTSFHFAPYSYWQRSAPVASSTVRLDDLRYITACMGYPADILDELLGDGYSVDEIEEALYSGEL